jgi:uncharacterized membrane protein YkvA (DUF1232 family)
LIGKFVASQVIKRAAGGKLNRPNKVQALLRLPALLKLGVALLRDNRVPVWQKGAAVGIIGVILSPIDVIGEIPVVGQFIDISLAVVVLDSFIQMAPAHVVNEHIAALKLEKKIPLREV